MADEVASEPAEKRQKVEGEQKPEKVDEDFQGGVVEDDEARAPPQPQLPFNCRRNWIALGQNTRRSMVRPVAVP
jgi:hypothetical protein